MTATTTVRRLSKTNLGKPVLLLENFGSADGTAVTITITANAATSTTSSSFTDASANYDYGITATPVAKTAAITGVTGHTGIVVSITAGAGSWSTDIPISPSVSAAGVAAVSPYFERVGSSGNYICIFVCGIGGEHAVMRIDERDSMF